MGLAFWSLTGLNASFFGQATSGRYQYIGRVFSLLIAAELLRGVARAALGGRDRARRLAAGDARQLLLPARQRQRPRRDRREGEGRPRGARAHPRAGGADFVLTENNSGVDYLGVVDAGPYFSAIDDFGSPAYTPAELATSSEQSRVAADMVFAAALGVALEPSTGPSPRPCMSVHVGPGPEIVALPPGGVVLRALDGSPRVALRRYATDEFPIALGALAEGQATRLAIPTDRSRQPWQLSLVGRRARLGLRARGPGVSGGRRERRARAARRRDRSRRRLGGRPAPAVRAARDRGGRLRRGARGAQLEADVLHRRLGGAAAPPRAQPGRLPRAPRRPPLDGARDALQGDPGDVRDGLGDPVRGRLHGRLPAQRRAALRLDARRVGAWLALAGVAAAALPGRRLRGPADAVPGRLLRPDRVRHRRAAGARARPSA